MDPDDTKCMEGDVINLIYDRANDTITTCFEPWKFPGYEKGMYRPLLIDHRVCRTPTKTADNKIFSCATGYRAQIRIKSHDPHDAITDEQFVRKYASNFEVEIYAKVEFKGITDYPIFPGDETVVRFDAEKYDYL